jgi:hypothetical protein
MTGDLRDSVAFRASREAAKAMIGEVDSLRWLLRVVDARLRASGVAGVATHVHLDIAEAIVDAHIEELVEPGLTAERSAQLCTDPRCLVVVAALHFVSTTHRPAALEDRDDLEILRWATDVARCELPVS